MRLIDAEDIGSMETRTDQKLIDTAPTVDAVPVVRCKDCEWWTKQEKSIQGRCALHGIYPTGGWYCGNGERKEDETD